ncbi:hypothetical protein [Kibdelosporangium philippinense]|nr:hypothetical protein [Kibdelosporangium philippinense]
MLLTLTLFFGGQWRGPSVPPVRQGRYVASFSVLLVIVLVKAKK